MINIAYFAFAPGHGASDPGAVLSSRKEKDDNLRLSLAVEAEMKKRGHKTIQFRTDDSVNCSASACRSWLEKVKADFAIVFHRNAFNKSATGVEVWCYDQDATIASALSKAIASSSGLYNRGGKPKGAAWLSSKVHCVEPEVGFIDNANDNTKFDNNFNKIVIAICDVLEKYYGKGTTTSSEFIAIGTTKNYLNIRKTPVNGAVLTSMPTGSKCNIYSIADGWAYLEYNGYKGYSSTDYMTVEYVKKEESKTETTTEIKKLYRVRTSWKVADSQQGAYENLDSAITKAKQTKCNVYDWNGKEVWNYTTWNKENTKPVVKEEPKSENKPAESAPKVDEKPATKPTDTAISAPEQSTSNEISFDKTIPTFIKILKQLVDMIIKLWKK